MQTQHTQAGGGTGLALGSVLRNRYKVSAMIGISGLEITYKAWDKQESRDVAIKEYCPQQLMSRANGISDYMLLDEYNDEYNFGLQKFMQEAKSLSAFNGDDNIVTAINGVYTDSNRDVVGVEYVNAAGIVSKTPFHGVNIVVTRYSDGTTTSVKKIFK